MNWRHFVLETNRKKESVLGRWRARVRPALVGLVENTADIPLVLGTDVDFVIFQGSKIRLTGVDHPIEPEKASNRDYPNGVSIGIAPHWEYLNHPTRDKTRIKLKANAVLDLAANVFISRGVYISVWPGRTLKVGEGTYIGHDTLINTKLGLEIGKNCLIGNDLVIMDYDGHPVQEDEGEENSEYGGKAKPITIGDSVWIGFRATILKGVRIGSGSIIGANSVVTRDVPENTMVAGSPARILKRGIKWAR